MRIRTAFPPHVLLMVLLSGYPFCGWLAVRMHGAADLVPKGGWPRETTLVCRAVLYDRAPPPLLAELLRIW